jgi:quinohemoprotein amine dehydrogenase
MRIRQRSQCILVSSRRKDLNPLDALKFSLPALALTLLANSLGAEGLPVKSDLVRDRCGACHAVDSEQRMSRISYVRKTPEGWEETIQRMMRLHGLSLTPADGRKIEQYLSDSHGLTASELQKVAYSLDSEDVEEQVPNAAVKSACTTCHSYAKIAGQRRTRQEWLNLKDFLLAMFPSLVYQHRFEDWPDLCDKALPWLAAEFPLETPEWKRESGQSAPSEGRWLVRGHQLGKGDYVGAIIFRAVADGGFETEAVRQFADGTSTTMNGRGQWLGASAWRGSGHSSDIDRAREVFQLSPDGNTQNGRWFPFQHPEQGAKEVRYRVDASSQIAGIMPSALRRGAVVVLRIYGADLDPRDPNLGDGIIIDKVVERASDHIIVQVHIAPEAKIGTRDVQVGGARLGGALTVYDKVDYIRVLPEKALARLGGVHAIPRFIQFEARAFSNGPDGIPGNADDLDLGLVKAAWTLGESFTTPNDEDAKYVGSIDQAGLFTPAQEGPNPQRQRSTNNAGDVWVNASYTPQESNVPLKTRAYLLVSVPAYRELISP